MSTCPSPSPETSMSELVSSPSPEVDGPSIPSFVAPAPAEHAIAAATPIIHPRRALKLDGPMFSLMRPAEFSISWPREGDLSRLLGRDPSILEIGDVWPGVPALADPA